MHGAVTADAHHRAVHVVLHGAGDAFAVFVDDGLAALYPQNFQVIRFHAFRESVVKDSHIQRRGERTFGDGHFKQAALKVFGVGGADLHVNGHIFISDLGKVDFVPGHLAFQHVAVMILLNAHLGFNKFLKGGGVHIVFAGMNGGFVAGGIGNGDGKAFVGNGVGHDVAVAVRGVFNAPGFRAAVGHHVDRNIHIAGGGGNLQHQNAALAVVAGGEGLKNAGSKLAGQQIIIARAHSAAVSGRADARKVEGDGDAIGSVAAGGVSVAAMVQKLDAVGDLPGGVPAGGGFDGGFFPNRGRARIYGAAAVQHVESQYRPVEVRLAGGVVVVNDGDARRRLGGVRGYIILVGRGVGGPAFRLQGNPQDFVDFAVAVVRGHYLNGHAGGARREGDAGGEVCAQGLKRNTAVKGIGIVLVGHPRAGARGPV